MQKTQQDRIANDRSCRQRLGMAGLVAGVLAAGLGTGSAAAAPTLISSVPYAITQPGAYQLTKDLTYSAATGDAILITASNVSLNGAGYLLTGTGSVTGAGIHVSGAAQVSITAVRITGFTKGLWLENASYATLTSSTATGNNVGILLSRSGHNTLTGNTANSNIHGIDLDQADANALNGNTASNNGVLGIGVSQSGGNNVHANITNGNGNFGIVVHDGSNNNLVDTNRAAGNTGYGITLGQSSSTLRGNIVSGNHTGIFLIEASGSLVQDNDASSNRVVGIHADPKSTGNSLLHNTARGNPAYDLVDEALTPCQNGWANNLYVTDNEAGIAAGPSFGCIR